MDGVVFTCVKGVVGMKDLTGVTRSDQYRALGLSTLAFTVCFAVWTIFSIIGVKIQQNLGLSETQFGILVATTVLTGSISRIFLGVWTEQYGGRLINTLQMVLTAIYFFVFNVGLAYLGVIDDFEHALVTAIVVGVLLIAPALFSSTVWAKRSPTVFLIDATHWVVLALACGFVQGLIV